MSAYVTPVVRLKETTGREHNAAVFVADTPEELRAITDGIGINRRRIRLEDTPREHVVLSARQRSRALSLGAKDSTRKEVEAIIANKIVTTGRAYGYIDETGTLTKEQWDYIAAMKYREAGDATSVG
jgi:hypothetical protein